MLLDFCDNCREFVADVVAENLKTPKDPTSIKGLDFIHEVIEDSSVRYVNIVTLNHDCLIENYLESMEEQFVDGFSKNGQGDSLYEPNGLTKNIPVKLIKLHGSIDWYPEKCDTGHRYVKLPSRPRGPSFKTLPVFLCGTDNKLVYYKHEPFHDLHNLWKRMLDEHHLMIMSGYGWNDQGINAKIEHWLSKTENRLVLLHQNPKAMLDNSDSMSYSCYEGYVTRGKIIPIHKWLKETDWNSVKYQLAQYKFPG